MRATNSAEPFWQSIQGPARSIDLVHLARQTLGDQALEREILSLFLRQSQTLAARIRASTDVTQGRDLAHTLKGSASAVGAWKVAEAADCVEQFCRKGGQPGAQALDAMECAVKDACTAIETMDRPS